jgi:glucokinase-like ROK family protein
MREGIVMPEGSPKFGVSDDALDALVAALDAVRRGEASTRPEIGARTGLGRTVVTQRVSQLMKAGFITTNSLDYSTGGRPARELRFRGEAGSVLCVELGATSLSAGIADLAGVLQAERTEPCDIGVGPDAVLSRVEALLDEMLADRPADGGPVWGLGVGLPGPVEYRTGRPMSPPIMPGWDRYPVRDRLAAHFNVPTWVDNDVNLMAIGELRAGLAVGESDVVVLKIGSGIGAGLISSGHLHRGAQGVAGDVGHIAMVDDPDVICRCGKSGCLEALVGGAALGNQATLAAREGRSAFLAARLATKDPLDASDLAEAANHGDTFAIEQFGRTGRYVGQMLAALINSFNPSSVIIGGGVAAVGDLLLASIRQTVYSRSLPLATRDLRIVRSTMSDEAGLRGAAFSVVDELFSRKRLARWIANGSPAGDPDLVYDTETDREARVS